MILHPSRLRHTPTDLHVEVSGETLRSFLQDVGDGYEATDAPVIFDGTAEVINDVITIHGRMQVAYRMTCVRCTVERDRETSWPIHWTLMPQAALNRGTARPHELVELEPDDLDISFYTGDDIDLTELIRESLILSLDHDAECGEKACDERLTELLKTQREAASTDDTVDPRWAHLATLKSKLKN